MRLKETLCYRVCKPVRGAITSQTALDVLHVIAVGMLGSLNNLFAI